MELMRRRDVPAELTWDLTAIYDDEAKLTADMEKIRQLTDEIEKTYKGRLTAVESIQACLDAGVRTIEHATWLTRDQCLYIKDAGDRHFVIPTLSVMQWCASIAETNNPDLYYLANRAAKVIDSAKESIARAYDEGLPLGWGTDLDAESLEKEPGQEFRLRKEWCGMSNIAMIRQATMNSAYIVGLGDVSGQIKPGYEADLLLYDGKPDEDISLFNTHPIVYKRGKLVDETFPVKE